MDKRTVEKRRFQRIPFGADAFLMHNENACRAKLLNISRRGALVSFEYSEVPSIFVGGKCLLSVYQSGNKGTLRFTTRVMRLNSETGCLRFLEMDPETKGLLVEILGNHKVAAERIGSLPQFIKGVSRWLIK
jgi:hypothetical protein